MNSFLKFIGYKHNYGGRDRSYRFTWGEVNLWSKSFGVYWSGPHYCRGSRLIIHLFFISFYIPTSSFGLESTDFNSNNIQWGFYLYPSVPKWENTVFLFGKKSWRWYMPWTYDWYMTECLDHNMNVILTRDKNTYKNTHWTDWHRELEKYREAFAREYPYTYTLRNGTIQHRKALVTVERMTWKMRWVPWVKKVYTSIDVIFTEEVGERTGSWKGGCTGCSWEMLPNETPEQTLRRMEKERIFK